MSDFVARITAELDTSKAEAQINALTSKKYKLQFENIDTASITKNFESEMSKVGKDAGSSFNKSLSQSLSSANINKQFAGLNNSITQTKKSLNGINTGGLNSFVSSVTKYFSAYRLMSSGLQELKNGFEFVNDLDDAITNISYTMDVSTSQLQQFSTQAVQMAQDLHTSAKTVLEASTLYANANESIESILTKTQTATMLANVTGMSGEKSAKTLQSIMNQFDLSQDDLLKISDTLQSVSQSMAYDFSAGINQISSGISTSGSVAKDAGLSLEQYSAMLGTIIEQTNVGGSTVGNALKTIFTRITKASATSGTLATDISKAEASLRSVGIEVRSSSGDFRDINDILGDLADKWDTLSDVEQSNIGFNVAGTRQTNIIKSLMKSWDDYEKRVDDATNLIKSPTLENQEKYADSMTGHLQELSAATEKFWATFIDTQSAKSAVDFLTETIGLLEKLTSTFGSLGAVGAGITLFSLFKNGGYFTAMTSALADSEKTLSNFGAAASMAGTDLKNFLKTPAGIATAVGAATAAIGIAVQAYQNYQKELRQTREAQLEQAQTAVSNADAFEKAYIVSSQYAGKTSLSAEEENQFKSAVEGASEALGNKSDALDSASGSAQSYIEKLKEVEKQQLKQAKINATKERDAAEKMLKSDSFSGWSGSKITMDLSGRTGVDEFVKAKKVLEKSMKDYIDLGTNGEELEPKNWDSDNSNMDAVVDYYYQLINLQDKLADKNLTNNDIYDDSSKIIKNLKDDVDAYTKAKYDELKYSYEAKNGIPTSVDEYNKMHDSILNNIDASKEYKDTLSDMMKEDFSDSIDFDSVGDSVVNTAEQIEKAATNAVNSIAQMSQKTQDMVSSVKSVQDVLDSQTTGKSLSLADWDNEGLQDYRTALEYVNGSLQLNADKVNEIIKEKGEEQIAVNDTNKAYAQSQYLANAGEIEKLRAKLQDSTFANGENAASVQSQIDTYKAQNAELLDAINSYNLMNASINEATGAYQNWLNAQNAAQSGDMFDSAVSAINKIDDTLNNSENDSYGRIGNSDYKAALEFVIPDKIDSDDEKAVDNYLDSISDYLTTDEDGNFNGMDISSFCQKAVDAGLMTLDESGENYKLAGEKTMQDFADGLNLSLPFVQAMFGEMEEFGAEFDWADEGVKTLGDLGVEANEAAESLREIKGNEDLKIVMDVSAFKDSKTACDTLDATIAEMNGIKGKINVDDSEVEQANAVIQYCVAQKQQLTAPAVMAVDTSQVQGKVGDLLSLLQQFQETKNTMDMKASVNADTSEAESKLNSLTNEIKDTSAKVGVDIDTSSVDSILSYISGLKPEAIVKLGVDASLIEGYEVKDTDATVKFDTDTSEPDNYKAPDKKAIVTYSVNHSLVDAYNPSNLQRTLTYTIVTKGSVPSGGSKGGKKGDGGGNSAYGTAHASGTAMASGNWGTASGGETLIGELGPEIVVNPYSGRWYTVGDSGAEFVNIPKNAIIFNHKQSESLLKYGYVSGRGTAEAWGTAMVRGSIPVSQTKKYNSSQHRSSWSSGNNKKASSSSKSSSSSSGNSSAKSRAAKSGTTKQDKSTKKGKTTAQKFQDWLSGMFNFAEVRLTRLNRLTEKWSEKAENAVRYSYNQTASNATIDKQYSAKQTYTQKAITATANEIRGNEKAESTYTKFMKKISKKGGLKAADRKRIRDDTINGTFDIKKYNADGKKLAAIKEYQTYYEKVLDCKDSVDDLRKSQLDLYDQLYNIPLDKAAAKVEKYENVLSRLSKTLSAVSGGSKVYLNQVVSDAQAAYNVSNSSASSTKKAYNKAQKNQKTAQKSFNKAQKSASKIKGLSRSQKNAVKSGKKLSTKGLSGNNLKKAQKYNSSLSNLNTKKSSTAKAKSAYSYASANRKSALAELKEAQAIQKKYANQPSYKYENYLLDQETQQKKNENTAQQEALRQANKNLSNTQKAKNSAIATRNKKKKTVDKKASSVLKKYSKNLSASQKKALKSGQAVSTAGLSGKALKAVKDYNAALKSYKSSAAAATTATDKYNAAVEAQAEADQNAAETQAEYTQAIQENAKAKFDNVSTSFESKQSVTNAKISKLNTQLSYRESKGYSQTSDYQKAVYQDSIKENQNLLASQKQELSELEAVYKQNSSNMSEEDRNAAQAEMESLRESILKTDATIADLQTDLNNIEVKKLEISMDRLQAQADKLQDALDLDETKGISATVDTYRKLISNSDAQIANLQKQNEEYRKQQQGLSVDSVKYQDLQSKIESNDSAIRSAQKSQEEWNNSIANLPYDRIEKLLDSLDAIADLNKSVSDLKSSLGEDLTADDYLQQISDNNDKISQLETERTQAYQDYLKALADANGVYGGKTADEWLSQYNQLGTQINNIKADNADIKKDMRDDVLWRAYDRAHDSCERYADVLSGVKDLIDDDMYFDKDGNLTDYGISQIANLVGEYENARKEVQNYSNDISNLNDLYSKGYYTQEEYNEKLAELQKGLTDSASDMKSAMNEIMDMYKDMAQSELDNLFKIIDARNKALSAKKEYYDYDKTISSKTKDIRSLQAQIAALEGVETAEAKAKKAKLEADLSEAQDDLNDTITDHMFDLSQDSLDDMKDVLQDAFDDKWDNLSGNLEEITNLMAAANNLTTSSATTINDTLNELLKYYGIDPVSTGVKSTVGYASGTKRVGKDQDAWVNELGTELMVSPSDSALYVGMRKDTGVLPADLTQNMFEWGALNPSDYLGDTIAAMQRLLDSGQKTTQLGNVVNQYYDSLLNVEGNVDSTVISDMKKFTQSFYKGAYEYTVKEIVRDARKVGIKV